MCFRLAFAHGQLDGICRWLERAVNSDNQGRDPAFATGPIQYAVSSVEGVSRVVETLKVLCVRLAGARGEPDEVSGGVGGVVDGDNSGGAPVVASRPIQDAVPSVKGACSMRCTCGYGLHTLGTDSGLTCGQVVSCASMPPD